MADNVVGFVCLAFQILLLGYIFSLILLKMTKSVNSYSIIIIFLVNLCLIVITSLHAVYYKSLHTEIDAGVSIGLFLIALLLANISSAISVQEETDDDKGSALFYFWGVHYYFYFTERPFSILFTVSLHSIWSKIQILINERDNPTNPTERFSGFEWELASRWMAYLTLALFLLNFLLSVLFLHCSTPRFKNLPAPLTQVGREYLVKGNAFRQLHLIASSINGTAKAGQPIWKRQGEQYCRITSRMDTSASVGEAPAKKHNQNRLSESSPNIPKSSPRVIRTWPGKRGLLTKLGL